MSQYVEKWAAWWNSAVSESFSMFITIFSLYHSGNASVWPDCWKFQRIKEGCWYLLSTKPMWWWRYTSYDRKDVQDEKAQGQCPMTLFEQVGTRLASSGNSQRGDERIWWTSTPWSSFQGSSPSFDGKAPNYNLDCNPFASLLSNLYISYHLSLTRRLTSL